MKTREFFLWILVLIPFIYLAILWNALPGQVPVHFTAEGPDNWASRSFLIFIPGCLTLGVYILMSCIPALDPKGKLKQMGENYWRLKFILVAFFCLQSCYILYISKEGELVRPNLINAMLGVLFAVIGNYFQTVRPNYFIGIRTPWALEDEEIWKSTHRLGGKLWVGGGLLIILLSFILRNTLLDAVMGGIIAIMVVIPMLHSYLAYRKKKQMQ